jgi:hypothetical protein
MPPGPALLLAALSFASVQPVPVEQAESVTIPRMAAPSIDGVLSENEWATAARLTLDHQTQPGDNVPPSERTEVRLGYDVEHLYVAVRAWDSDATAIRARVTRRDDIAGDDYVTVHLDTYDDRRRAYVFAFNPLGIQSDGIYNEGTATGRNFDANIDRTWDGVLISKGAVTEDGFVIEAAIPFSTLRFAAGADRRWGLHVQRWIARKAENVSWQPLSRESASLLTQMGAIGGLRDVRGQQRLELQPTLVSSLTSEPRPGDRVVRVGDAEPGLTSNFAVTPNMALAGTINPDFSQIEADVPQIEVNQRFPLFYPEKRPFFYEGGQFFRSPGALTFVNTRQIVDPDWGAKLTGKIGRNTVAAIVASDAAPGAQVPPSSPAYQDNATFLVGRYQRDFLDNSTIGGFITNRRFAGDRNTVFAVDGQLRLPLNTIGFQAAGSSTVVASTPGTVTGSATYVWYDHVGRHFRLFVNDLRITDDYDSEVGFLRRTGFRANSANIGYEFQSDSGRWWVRARPFVVGRYLKTSDGFVDESYVDPGLDLTLARDIRLYTYYSFHQDAFEGREYPYQFYVADFTVNTLRRLTLAGRVQVGEAVNFDPARALVGRNLDSSVTVTFKPDDRLNSEWLYLVSRLRHPATEAELFEQQVIRTRTNYQFTRDHGSRLIAEYDTFSRRVSLSLLYSYTPRPTTAIYVGYGDLLLNGRDPFDARPRDGLYRVRSTFFVKLALGWRR